MKARLKAIVLNVIFPPSKLKRQLQESDCSAESVSSWWERHHTGRSRWWLTGSSGDKEWSNLVVQEYIKPKLRVLNIGVGLGHGTKALANRDCIVDALDISPTALDRVREYTLQRWLAADIGSLPSDYYDLGLSFLVAQHMSHADLQEQLRQVIRALKPSGLFAIHVPRPLSDEPLSDDSCSKQKSGAVMRSPEAFAAMVGRAGVTILRQKELTRFPQYDSAWMVYHLVRVTGQETILRQRV
jgi:SAM-dependent methyltransferase